MQDEFRIRVLGPEQAKIFQTLRLKALRESPEAFSSSYAEESHYTLEFVAGRLSSDSSRALGAFASNGELIGMTGIYRERHIKLNHKAVIFGMYVTPEFRGRGIGRRLLEEAISQAKNIPGIRRLNLSVVSVNKPAVKLYESAGFITYGREKEALKVEGKYLDEKHMSLQI